MVHSIHFNLPQFDFKWYHISSHTCEGWESYNRILPFLPSWTFVAIVVMHFSFIYIRKPTVHCYFFLLKLLIVIKRLNNKKKSFILTLLVFFILLCKSRFPSGVIFPLPEAHYLTFLVLWICFWMFENVIISPLFLRVYLLSI